MSAVVEITVSEIVIDDSLRFAIRNKQIWRFLIKPGAENGRLENVRRDNAATGWQHKTGQDKNVRDAARS